LTRSDMPQRHVVVDGSNIATEGRSLPSLTQLDQAVREFLGEFPDDVVHVVVDASFAHRISPSEVATFEEAEAAGEVVSPPAGAIGRGDAFLLRIADKTGATVLSNDSFQEFHGEHEWLFESGRLIGGKPVSGVGWIFTPRTPVRGPKSREAVKEAKRKKRDEGADATATGLDLAALRGGGRGKKVERAIATATEEAVEPSASKRRRRRKGSEPPSDPINEPLAFITFIATHPLGSEVRGRVESFSSHGAFVEADGARCYVPLSAMGDPPPRSAREVLSRTEEHVFAVQALDPLRRGVELALPGFAHPAGAPTAETVEAETQPRFGDDTDEDAVVRPVASPRKARAPRRPDVAPPLAEGEDRGDRPAIGASKAAPPLRRVPRDLPVPGPVPAPAVNGDAVPAPDAEADLPPAVVQGQAKKAATTKAASTKTAAAKSAPKKAATTKKAAGAKAAPVKNATGTKVATTKKAATKKAATVKTAAGTKAATTKKSAGTEATPVKTVGGPTKDAVSNGVPEKAAPMKATPKTAAEKKAAAATGGLTTKEVTTKKAATKKAATKKAATKKAASKKVVTKKAITTKAATTKAVPKKVATKAAAKGSTKKAVPTPVEPS